MNGNEKKQQQSVATISMDDGDSDTLVAASSHHS